MLVRTAPNEGIFSTSPWRVRENGPSMEELWEEHRREEALFQKVLAEAQMQDVAIEDLCRTTVYLAFPKAQAEDVERTVARLTANIERWHTGVDEGGNPLWISILPREKADGEELVIPKTTPDLLEAPPVLEKKDPADKSKKRRIFSRASSGKQKTKASSCAEPEADATHPPLTLSPFQRVLRIIIVTALFAILYRYVSGGPVLPKFF